METVTLTNSAAYNLLRVLTSQQLINYQPLYNTRAIHVARAFNTAFIAGYLQQQDLLHCLKIANMAGALCVTVRGVVEAIPTLEDIQRFLERRNYVFR